MPFWTVKMLYCPLKPPLDRSSVLSSSSTRKCRGAIHAEQPAHRLDQPVGLLQVALRLRQLAHQLRELGLLRRADRQVGNIDRCHLRLHIGQQRHRVVHRFLQTGHVRLRQQRLAAEVGAMQPRQQGQRRARKLDAHHGDVVPRVRQPARRRHLTRDVRHVAGDVEDPIGMIQAALQLREVGSRRPSTRPAPSAPWRRPAGCQRAAN